MYLTDFETKCIVNHFSSGTTCLYAAAVYRYFIAAISIGSFHHENIRLTPKLSLIHQNSGISNGEHYNNWKFLLLVMVRVTLSKLKRVHI